MSSFGPSKKAWSRGRPEFEAVYNQIKHYFKVVLRIKIRYCFHLYVESSLHSLPGMRCPRRSLDVSSADADYSHNPAEWWWGRRSSLPNSLPRRCSIPHAYAYAPTNASAVPWASDRGASVLWWNLPMQRQGNQEQKQETQQASYVMGKRIKLMP